MSHVLDAYTLRAVADELTTRGDDEHHKANSCGCGRPGRHQDRAEYLAFLAAGLRSDAIRADLTAKEATDHAHD